MKINRLQFFFVMPSFYFLDILLNMMFNNKQPSRFGFNFFFGMGGLISFFFLSFFDVFDGISNNLFDDELDL